MAQLTTGKTWASGETVTPALLNQMVNSATIAFVTAADTDDSTLEASGGKLRAKDGGITTTKLASTTQQSLVPAGAVMPFAMNSAPSGWLSANGDAVSRSTYAALFAAIGTTHGAGDGSTTFNLPDLRGIFVRGSGSQTISGTTYNKTFAAKERDAFQGHWHELTNSTNVLRFAGGSALGGNPQCLTYNLEVKDPTTDGTNGTPRTASETRPANIALLYCIKH